MQTWCIPGWPKRAAIISTYFLFFLSFHDARRVRMTHLNEDKASSLSPLIESQLRYPFFFFLKNAREKNYSTLKDKMRIWQVTESDCQRTPRKPSTEFQRSSRTKAFEGSTTILIFNPISTEIEPILNNNFK